MREIGNKLIKTRDEILMQTKDKKEKRNLEL